MLRPLLLPIALLLLASSCEKPQSKNTNFEMGEKVDAGTLSYVVVESAWRTQLGEGFSARAPQNRFLVLSLSITNNGGSEVSVPLLSVEASNGQLFQELEDGAGISNWLGVLRTVGPGQTLQGRVVFDVPFSTFRLRLPDDGETGYERFSWVQIPLRMDPETVQAPLPGGGGN